VYYADGSPVAGVRVDVQGADGASVGSVTTDGEGRFAYAPQEQGDLVFVVETDDGHRAESAYTSTMPSGPTSPAAGPAAPRLVDSVQIQQIVQEELRPLREQLDAYQHEIRVRDILGGVGYIVGVLGLVAWIKARRPGRAP
jgi:nickel transport protein